MILPTLICQLLKEKSATQLLRPADFAVLSECILEKTGERLSVNTLKRLFGTLAEVDPTQTTLNIIAQYLEYPTWSILQKELEGTNSGFGDCPDCIFPKEFHVGQQLYLVYSPDRELILEVQPDKTCKVIHVNKGKLYPGDFLRIESILLNAPLVVKEVVRGGVSLGTYTGAKEGGVLMITVIS
ncbi:hypothetical protein [Bacteroides sp. 224]|uniref:hypothetical protein n=1 Tax=Bacteroides sp. 224 TaxID=2302936 RepID=UPI0013D2173C|nr:hypothetical protein [Bacteroides sp. 224]NDV65597.1 hypothetical protein [Bacteroides sp. 224]